MSSSQVYTFNEICEKLWNVMAVHDSSDSGFPVGNLQVTITHSVINPEEKDTFIQWVNTDLSLVESDDPNEEHTFEENGVTYNNKHYMMREIIKKEPYVYNEEATPIDIEDEIYNSDDEDD